MKYSYSWLKELVDVPSIEELVEKLSLRAFEVEEYDGDVIDVDITANRVSDCASHLGLAREISVIFDTELKLPEEYSGDVSDGDFSIELDSDNCSRYTALIFDVEVGESSDLIQERLRTCGLQPINSVVDVMNYVMLETGQPLHAFDLDKVKGGLHVRQAKGEKMTTLDDRELSLDEEMLVIADDEGVLALAGIKGGKGAGVTDDTKRVIVEGANFNPSLIRRTSQAVRLQTDASLRFEHGLDPNLTLQALLRTAQMLKAEDPEMVDVYPEESKARHLSLRFEELSGLLGENILIKDVVSILEGLGFEIEKQNKERVLVKVPTRRLDVEIEEDLIEEVGRIYGYENIEAKLPTSVLSSEPRNEDIYWEELTKDSLKESGFTEVYNYSFVSGKQAEEYNLGGLIEVANPLSKHYQYLSPSLVPNLVESAETNLKNFDEAYLFELGAVFQKEEGKELAGLIASSDLKKEDFFRLKGALESLFDQMKIDDVVWDSTPEDLAWDSVYSSEIEIRGEKIGFIGFLEEGLFDGEMVLFSLDFNRLREWAEGESEYQLISPYPIAKRDLSVLTPVETKVVSVLNIINEEELVRDVDLFDIYFGASEGRKSLAFHIFYQADDRTLDKEEISKVHNKIIERLEDNDWEVRD